MPKTTPDTPKKQEARSLRDFFTELLRSFRPAAYPALVKRGPSAAALYLVGVAALATVALTPVLYVLHDDALGREQARVDRVLPEALIFEDSTASYDGEQPYTYVEDEAGLHSVLIVDTTGRTTEIGDEFVYGMLITDKAVIHKVPIGGGRSQTYEDPIPETEGRIGARQYYFDLLEQKRWPGFIMLIGQRFIETGVVVFVLAGFAAIVAYGLELTQRAGRLPISTCFGVTAHAATPLMVTTACLPAVLASAGSSMLLFYMALGLPLLLFFLLAARGIQACRPVEEAHADTVRKAT